MKCKQFIAGFISCLILLSAIFIIGYAEGISVIINPYPIIFNGQPAQIEAYNINGRTFLSLGDVASYFNAEAKLNEVTKQIEVTTTAEEVMKMNRSAAIEYDLITKLPVGAEIVEWKDCKEAVRYEGNIYLSVYDLRHKFGVNYAHMDVKAHTETFIKDTSTVIVDTQIPGNRFLNSVGRAYYNVELFCEIIGE